MNNIKYNVVDDSPFSFQNTFPPASTGASSGSNLSMKSDVTSFDKKIQNYIEKTKPRLYILTPCYGGMCYVNFVSSLTNTLDSLRQLGIEIMVEFCKNDSLVSVSYTHLTLPTN